MLGRDKNKLHMPNRVPARSHVWCPPTDVFELDNIIMIRVEIAGMHDDDFSISLDGSKLTIQGARPHPVGPCAYHQMEIQFGAFKSEIQLRWAIEAQSIAASYRDGFLELTIPKAKTQKITIEN